MIKLKETNHSYYCSDSNFYVDGYSNFGLCEYNDWDEFKESWLDNNNIDDDYNHCFRFDIKLSGDINDKPTGQFEVWLFFILQRKGIYRPVQIKNIMQSDMVEINDFLKNRFEYLKSQWEEFSDKENKNDKL